MNKLKIRTRGDLILTKKAKKITTPLDQKIKELAKNMVKAMDEENGIGLAAPQIGVSQRIIVIKSKDGSLVLVNPRIKKKSLRTNCAEEGCLSVPGIFGIVRRHNSVTVESINLDNKSLKFKAKGLMARVIQHEIDHLNGILFIDKIAKNGSKTKDERKI